MMASHVEKYVDHNPEGRVVLPSGSQLEVRIRKLGARDAVKVSSLGLCKWESSLFLKCYVLAALPQMMVHSQRIVRCSEAYLLLENIRRYDNMDVQVPYLKCCIVHLGFVEVPHTTGRFTDDLTRVTRVLCDFSASSIGRNMRYINRRKPLVDSNIP